MTFRHLVQYLREEALLHLGCLLDEGVSCGGSLGLAKYTEPLFDGT